MTRILPTRPRRPIASDNWYTTALKQHLLGVPAENILFALGGYGYDWSETAQLKPWFSKYHEPSQRYAIRNNIRQRFAHPNLMYTDNGTAHRLWFLDGATFINETSEMLGLGNPPALLCGGSARKNPSIWNFFGSGGVPDQQSVDSLKILTQAMESNIKAWRCP